MRTMTVILMSVLLIGCDPSKPAAPSGKSSPHGGNINNTGDQSRVSDSEGASFGVPNTLSGKLSDEQEQMVPEALRGAFKVEALLPITTKALVKELQFKSQVAEETRGGKHRMGSRMGSLLTD